jgi:hypothetical protein
MLEAQSDNSCLALQAPACNRSMQDPDILSLGVNAGSRPAVDSSVVQLPVDAPDSALQPKVAGATNLSKSDVEFSAGCLAPHFDGNVLPAQPFPQHGSVPFDGSRSLIATSVCDVCASPSCVCSRTHNHTTPCYDPAFASIDDGLLGICCIDTAGDQGQ